MKIVGGSFGVRGSAFVAKGRLHIEGSTEAAYRPEELSKINTRVDAVRKFGVIGAIVGAVVLGAVGWALLAIFGAIIGVALAIAGSFYTRKKNIAEVTFEDGATLILECTPRAVDKLIQFKSGG